MPAQDTLWVIFSTLLLLGFWLTFHTLLFPGSSVEFLPKVPV
jgi:hypothetical protein